MVVSRKIGQTLCEKWGYSDKGPGVWNGQSVIGRFESLYTYNGEVSVSTPPVTSIPKCSFPLKILLQTIHLKFQ